MFQVNDVVLYGGDGICQIVDISRQTIHHQTNTYYILRPLADPSSSTWVPLGNERALQQMRPVLSSAEIRQLVEEIPEEDLVWIENDAIRREKYKQILQSGDRTAIMRLIKTLYLQQKEKTRQGKKLHNRDEQFLKEAEKLLYGEFAYVLHIKPEEVPGWILHQLGMDQG